jgi:DNA-binding response OmpR family regulator
MNSILIINYHPRLTAFVQEILTAHRVRVALVQKADYVKSELSQVQAQMVILPVPVVDKTVIRQCRELRHMLDVVPLVLIVEDRSSQDTVMAIDAGVDLVLSYPLPSLELNARLQALLRRHITTMASGQAQLTMLNPDDFLVEVDDRVVKLTQMEFQLLNYLCQHQNRYLSARELLGAVWKYPPGSGDTALVRNHIRNLRLKLETNPDIPRIVEALPKRGYRINARVRWQNRSAGQETSFAWR